MTESLCIRHSFQNRSQDSQRKTSRKQPWNWRPSAVPSLCRSKPSLSYTEGHMSSKVCWSPRQLKELQTGTKRCSLQQGREGSWKQLQETLLGTTLKKELSMPDARWHRHVIHLTATLGYDLKGNYNVCRSTVFVFQLSTTTARKCELRLGEEGVQRRIPVSSLHMSSQTSVSDGTNLPNSKGLLCSCGGPNALPTEMADVLN